MKSISDKVCLLKPLDEEDEAGHLSTNAIDIVNGEVNYDQPVRE